MPENSLENALVSVIIQRYASDAERREAFIEKIEESWNLVVLTITEHTRPGVAVLQAAWDRASSADHQGAIAWLQRMSGVS